MPRICLSHPDVFCSVRGELTFKSQERNFIPLIKKFYELYFACKVSDEDKSWVLHICCVTCVRLITGWLIGSHQMPFAIPIVWKAAKDQTSSFYVFLANVSGITSKSKHTVKHPDLLSAIRSVPHSKELPVPKPPENLTFLAIDC
jgi:hypothetical protein